MLTQAVAICQRQIAVKMWSLVGFIESAPLLSRVPDAATLRDSVTLLKNAVYARERYQVCATNLHKIIGSSSVYRKYANPSGVPDTATLGNHRISHLDSMYARAAEGEGLCPKPR